jgi:valyl-tRNA synthetase
MDTWATSSVTPQINCNWAEDEEGCKAKMPMDMRFCGREIITTWCLRTIIKAYYHQGCLPWKSLIVNGWVMADKGIKISKHLSNSKMNLNDLLSQYGADVIRYWCAIGAYGRDVMFSDDGLKDGYKLLNKLWNASKFVLSFLEDYTPAKPKNILPMDRFIMHKFNEAYKKTVEQYKNVEMGYAKNEIEKFFWNFCDNYIELAKNRLYKPEVYGQEAKSSAQWACYNVLLGMLQANILSYGDEVFEIVSRVRQFKSENKLSLKTEISQITISSQNLDFVKSCEQDIKAVTAVREIKYKNGDFAVEIGQPIQE